MLVKPLKLNMYQLKIADMVIRFTGLKITGKKNMQQIIDLYNANEEHKKKRDENYVNVNFPFFFSADDDLMLKTKVDAVDNADLDKDKAYKLNITF